MISSNSQNAMSKIASVIGIAGAGILLSLPALAMTHPQSSNRGLLIAQSSSGSNGASGGAIEQRPSTLPAARTDTNTGTGSVDSQPSPSMENNMGGSNGSSGSGMENNMGGSNGSSGSGMENNMGGSNGSSGSSMENNMGGSSSGSGSMGGSSSGSGSYTPNNTSTPSSSGSYEQQQSSPSSGSTGGVRALW